MCFLLGKSTYTVIYPSNYVLLNFVCHSFVLKNFTNPGQLVFDSPCNSVQMYCHNDKEGLSIKDNTKET